ncbi:MAG: amidase family protein [Pseudomonadota bacterium]
MINRRHFMQALAVSVAAAPMARASSSDPGQMLAHSDGIELARLVAAGEVTPALLLEAAIERTKNVNQSLNFIAHLAEDYGRAALEVAPKSAPLSGVPLLVKDLWMDMPGVPTGNGSSFWAGHVPRIASTLLSRYENAGLIPFGKTTTPELGLTATTESVAHGLTRNPWDKGKTAGGSSGGAGVAVAAGVVPIAHASDGGGSIRTPASCCGVFGLKPSRGRVPLGPNRTEGWLGLSTSHVITRSVRDSALMLDLTSGPELGARYVAPPPKLGSFLAATQTPPKPLKVALMLAPPSGSHVDEDCLKSVADAAALCETLGHSVTEAAPQLDAQAINDAMLAVLTIETKITLDARAQAIGRSYGQGDVEPVTLWMAQQGAKQSPTAYARANRVFQTAAIAVSKFMEDYDLVLSPTLAKAPVELGRLSLSPTNFDAYVADVTTFGPFTAWANQTGQPSMSVPLYWNGAGLPIGSMFTARYGDEETLLSLAAQLEKARPWFDRRPPALT